MKTSENLSKATEEKKTENDSTLLTKDWGTKEDKKPAT